MNAKKLVARDTNGAVDVDASTKLFLEFLNGFIAGEAHKADQTVAAIINVFHKFGTYELSLNALSTYAAVEMKIDPNMVGKFKTTVRDIVRSHSAFDVGSGRRITRVRLVMDVVSLDDMTKSPRFPGPDPEILEQFEAQKEEELEAELQQKLEDEEEKAEWQHPQNLEKVRTIHPKKAKRVKG